MDDEMVRAFLEKKDEAKMERLLRCLHSPGIQLYEHSTMFPRKTTSKLRAGFREKCSVHQ